MIKLSSFTSKSGTSGVKLAIGLMSEVCNPGLKLLFTGSDLVFAGANLLFCIPVARAAAPAVTAGAAGGGDHSPGRSRSQSRSPRPARPPTEQRCASPG